MYLSYLVAFHRLPKALVMIQILVVMKNNDILCIQINSDRAPFVFIHIPTVYTPTLSDILISVRYIDLLQIRVLM